MLFEIHLTYFNFLIWKSNGLKIHKFVTNLNYILFYFEFFTIYSNTRKSFFLIFFSFIGASHDLTEPNLT